MSEKRFKVCIDNNSVGLLDNSVKLIFIKFTNKEDAVSCKDSLKYQCNLMNELYDENEQLKEENEQLKQKIQRWKNLYEIKDAEVTARVDALNKVCEYYTSEVLFKSDTDPNRAVKEVLNEILNTEVKK